MPQPEDLIDDLTVEDPDLLWRRIPPDQWVSDENLGRLRPSSGCFSDSSDGSPMSIDLGTESLKDNRGPEEMLLGLTGFGVVEFTAGFCREHGQGIVRDPVDGNDYHAGVFGKKTRGVKNSFAMNSRVVIQGDPVKK